MYSTEIKGIKLNIETDSDIFSPSAADRGTLAMLSETEFRENDRVLDLGCGCGIVGILAAKLTKNPVVMCDISENAVRISRENAQNNGVHVVSVSENGGTGIEYFPSADIRVSNAYSNINERDFTLILSNPPYHTDFSVAKSFIEGGFRKLAAGGRLVMVTKRLDWYKNKLSSVFGGVKVRESDGYYVFTAEKRSEKPKANLQKEQKKQGLSKKLQRRQAGRKRKEKI